MQKEDDNPLVLFFASVQLLAIVCLLLILLIWGTNNPKPLIPGLILLLSVGFLYRAAMDYWHAVRRDTKGFKLKALGSSLAGVALFDAWWSNNSFGSRDIFLLLASGLAILPSIWAQVAAMRK